MKDLLIPALESLGYDVFLQGTLAEDSATPDHYITFLTISSNEASSFDNDTALTAWRYQIAFYSVDPALLATEAARIRATLKAAGFIPIGKGRDLPSGEPTHTGWTQDFYYLENEGVIE